MSTLKEPENLQAVMDSLEETLPKGMFVCGIYGTDPDNQDYIPRWCLRVYTDLADTSAIPKEWQGYTVLIRKTARAY